MNNYTVEIFDLSKARDNKQIYLEGSNYNSFFVIATEGTAEISFTKQGDKLKLGDEINKMTGLQSFNEIYLTHSAQEGKKIKILFGQNLGSDKLEAFQQLSQFGVDINSTVGLTPGDINLDGSKNIGVNLKSEDINLGTKLDKVLKESNLNLDPNKNQGVNLENENIGLINKLEEIRLLLVDIKTNTSP